MGWQIAAIMQVSPVLHVFSYGEVFPSSILEYARRHSLGGAVAVLATLRLLKQLPPERGNLPLSCIAFATPRFVPSLCCGGAPQATGAQSCQLAGEGMCRRFHGWSCAVHTLLSWCGSQHWQ